MAMLAVLKQLTNLFVLGGDYLLYNRTYKLNVWGCVALMLLAAICGAATDLVFDALGYLWQIINCMFTAGYALYMRGAMDRVAKHTSDGKKLGEFSMVRLFPEAACSCPGRPPLAARCSLQVFYNNLLSLPFLLLIMAATGEAQTVWQEPDLHNTTFLLVAGFSGLIGFAVRWGWVYSGGRRTVAVILMCTTLFAPLRRLLQLCLPLLPEQHDAQHLFAGWQLEQGAAGHHWPAGLQRALDAAKHGVHTGRNVGGGSVCSGQEQELGLHASGNVGLRYYCHVINHSASPRMASWEKCWWRRRRHARSTPAARWYTGITLVACTSTILEPHPPAC